MATLTKSTGTVTLSGAVEKVTFPAVYGWVWVKNMSDGDMFVGLDDGVSAGADGVLSIPAGECGRIQTDGQDSVYLIGSGNALVVAQNYADCPFKLGGKGGESPDLSAYAKTVDVPNIKVNSAVNADTVGGLTVNEIATNPNLLINPDFKINQRNRKGWAVDYNDHGIVDTSTQIYIMDRWRIMDGTITIADEKVWLSGTIIQVLENSIGSDFTATVSVESGTATASYDDSTKTFTIVGDVAALNWAKLEYGSNATQFFPPDTATELLKCKRFYRTLNRGTLAYLSNSNSVVFVETIDMPMRVNPDVKIVSSVKLTYCNGWIDEPNVSDISIISVNITKMGVCYLHVGGFNMTVNGTAFAENSSFRAATDNFIGLDAEIY